MDDPSKRRSKIKASRFQLSEITPEKYLRAHFELKIILLKL